MAVRNWLGTSAAASQVQTYLFGGTWEADDLIRATIGTKTVDFVAGSTVITTILDSLVTAWGALDQTAYPEFAAVTPSRSGNSLVLTSVTAGVPFTCTLTPLESGGGAADAQTIGGAGVATTGTTATASGGPNDWSVAANWSGGVVPVSGDTVNLYGTTASIMFGLAQAAVTGVTLNRDPSYTGNIGLPEWNPDGYFEWRQTYLALGATTVNYGAGGGGVQGWAKLDTGSGGTTLNVYATAQTGEAAGADGLLWKGTGTNNLNVTAGSLGVAMLPGETAAWAFLQVGSGGARVRCGPGVTQGTLEMSGGEVELAAGLTTAKKYDGTLTITGTGAVSNVYNYGGTFYPQSSGTITTLKTGKDATADFTRDPRSKTVFNCTMEAGSVVRERGNVTFTNPITVNARSLADVTADIASAVSFVFAVP